MTTMPPSLRLAELLAARLCHDMAGQLGTAIGLVELAEETHDSEALATARDATLRLGQRLRLLRAAWAADPAPLSPRVLEALAEGLPSRAQIKLDITNLMPVPEFSPDAGRVVLNLLLLGAEALPAGGTISLSGAANREVLLRISGARAAWPSTLPRYLLDPSAIWTNLTELRTLQVSLTVLLATQAGHRLSLLMPMTSGSDTPAPILLQLG